MESQGENGSNGKIFIKSPQELASQVNNVSLTILEHVGHPDGKNLDEKYIQDRKRIEELLKDGVTDEELLLELEKQYQEGTKSGLFNPLKSENADEYFERLKAHYFPWSNSEKEAEERARKNMAINGFIGGLRSWRRDYENDINLLFSKFNEAHPISSQEENEQLVKLRERCIWLDNPESAKQLATDFPGGNYLFHGAAVQQAIEIAGSGNLVNVKSLYDQEQDRVVREGGEAKVLTHHSGFEGISWNFNGIGALPGDRYHLVGFLASPNTVLNGHLQLAVPSRPAPSELILISGEIDINRYYANKVQVELLSYLGIEEYNSVWSNIAYLSFDLRDRASSGSNLFSSGSILAKYSESEISDEKIAEMLRATYSLRENGTVEFSNDLLQQPDNAIPLGAVWLQALIDTGRINNIHGFEDCKTVREVIARFTPDSYKSFVMEYRKDKQYDEDRINEDEEKVTGIAIPTADMYMVLPDRDLTKWLKVLARVKEPPKGILVYDHNKVRLENFASTHRGDNKAMEDLLRNAIPQSEGYIDYEKDILDDEITPDKMIGHKKHIIGEKHIKTRKSIRKDDSGNLVVS